MTFGNSPNYELERLRDEMSRLQKETKHVGVVVAKTENRGLVQLIGGALFEAEIPKDIHQGDAVTCLQNGRVFAKMKVARVGTLAKVIALAGDRVETLFNGQTRFVFFAPGLELEPNDDVILDPTGSVIVERVRAGGDASSLEPARFDDVLWDDIAGQEEAKMALKESALYPFLNPALYRKYRARTPKGVLLCGPPGNGKTMLGRALATELRNNRPGHGGFFYVKGPQFLNEFLGKTERGIRDVFTAARRRATDEGSSIIFFDEGDALFGDRTQNRVLNFEKTTVPTFLSELDGLVPESGVMVVIATNRPDAIDGAVIRDGRIDYRVEVPRPSGPNELAALFRVHLRGVPFDFAGLEGDGETAKRDHVIRIAVDTFRSAVAFKGEVGEAKARAELKITLEDCASGALVEGVVQRAVRLAIARDRDSNLLPRTRGDVVSGVSRADLYEAIEATARTIPPTELRDAIVKKASELKVGADGLLERRGSGLLIPSRG
jgi:proteasome-associated ATPase